jgi:L-alanine-DL-glutamate epimerase-like enolase superfamily enzyme
MLRHIFATTRRAFARRKLSSVRRRGVAKHHDRDKLRRYGKQLKGAAMPHLMRLETWPIEYPVVGRFKFLTPAPGLPKGRRTVVVRLTADDGSTGWGQAVPSHRWSYETPETVRSTIDLYLAPALLGADLDDPADFAQRLAKAVGPGFSTGHPIAKAALDLALWDLRGRRQGKSFVELWRHASPYASRRSVPPHVTLSWTINTDNLADAESSLADALGRGYRNFNVKVSPDPQFDVDLCRRVRQASPDGFIWCDANTGYNLENALAAAPGLADLGIAAMEQPFPPNQLGNYKRLRAQRALPILMDESIVSNRDFLEFFSLELLDGVAVKLSRMGGLTEAARLIDQLENLGAKFFASGLTDPDLSLAATLQLFAGGGLTTPAALNAPQFLRGSILDKPLIADGDQLRVPTGPGLGVDVDLDQLTALSE